MKTLVVFYSLEGNTKYIAETVAKELDADILEVKAVKAFPSKGFKKFVWGGKSVVFKQHPDLEKIAVDVKSYDNIVVGSPVWASSYASPLHTFFRDYNFKNKNTAFFACHMGGGAEKCMKAFKLALPSNNVVGETDFVEPLHKGKEENHKKAIDWAKSLSFKP